MLAYRRISCVFQECHLQDCRSAEPQATLSSTLWAKLQVVVSLWPEILGNTHEHGPPELFGAVVIVSA